MEAFIPILIYAGIGLFILILGVLFYMRAVVSRKAYRCPQCGENVRVELMEASHCNTCGAKLEFSERNHAES